MSSSSQIPKYAQDLMTLYGSENQSLQEVAVFYEQVEPETDLEEVALRYYRQYVGVYWERFGEPNWMGGWELLYERPPGKEGDIVNEFKAMIDIFDVLLIMLQLEDDHRKTATQKLADAYDAPDVTDLRIYQIGDTEAIEGRLIIGSRRNGETTIIVLSYG